MANTNELTFTKVVPASHLAKRVVVNLRVTGMNVWRARLWLAASVFAVGGWVAGTEVRFQITND